MLPQRATTADVCVNPVRIEAPSPKCRSLRAARRCSIRARSVFRRSSGDAPSAGCSCRLPVTRSAPRTHRAPVDGAGGVTAGRSSETCRLTRLAARWRLCRADDDECPAGSVLRRCSAAPSLCSTALGVARGTTRGGSEITMPPSAAVKTRRSACTDGRTVIPCLTSFSRRRAGAGTPRCSPTLGTRGQTFRSTAAVFPSSALRGVASTPLYSGRD
jgi:hypothetical protein